MQIIDCAYLEVYTNNSGGTQTKKVKYHWYTGIGSRSIGIVRSRLRPRSQVKVYWYRSLPLQSPPWHCMSIEK
jgi:hypothetical protein